MGGVPIHALVRINDRPPGAATGGGSAPQAGEVFGTGLDQCPKSEVRFRIEDSGAEDDGWSEIATCNFERGRHVQTLLVRETGDLAIDRSPTAAGPHREGEEP
jgi:hypothetical protein